MKNRLSDLYNHLYLVLETLKDAKPTNLEFEIKRADAIRLTASTVIDAAKVEVSYLKVNPEAPQQSHFFDLSEESALPANPLKQLDKGKS